MQFLNSSTSKLKFKNNYDSSYRLIMTYLIILRNIHSYANKPRESTTMNLMLFLWQISPILICSSKFELVNTTTCKFIRFGYLFIKFHFICLHSQIWRGVKFIMIFSNSVQQSKPCIRLVLQYITYSHLLIPNQMSLSSLRFSLIYSI